MRVKIWDREYLIEFAYDQVYSEPYRGKRTATVRTTCLIRDGSAPRAPNEPATILVSGQVVRYHKDQPNREIGRKAALTAALFQLDMTHSMALGGAKERRRAFWAVYLNRKKQAPTRLDMLIAELAVKEMNS